MSSRKSSRERRPSLKVKEITQVETKDKFQTQSETMESNCSLSLEGSSENDESQEAPTGRDTDIMSVASSRTSSVALIDAMETQKHIATLEIEMKQKEEMNRLSNQKMELEERQKEEMKKLKDQMEEHEGNTALLKLRAELEVSKRYIDEEDRARLNTDITPPPPPSPPVAHLNLKAITLRPKESTMKEGHLLAEMIGQLSRSHLPAAEPELFHGDPIQFPQWKANFTSTFAGKNISPAERIMYLKKYLAGPAKESVEAFSLLGTDSAYEQAMSMLETRFGSEWQVAEAFKGKLNSWPKLQNRDCKALQSFSDYLMACQIASTSVHALSYLDDPFQQQAILRKLPDYICSEWNKRIRKMSAYPKFSTLVQFIQEKADEENDPVTSLNALHSLPMEKKLPRSIVRTTETKEVESKNKKYYCVHCSINGHSIQYCRKFGALENEDKKNIILQQKLCFGCLKVGHLSKACKDRATCGVCQRKHPTALHNMRPESPPTEEKAPEKEIQATNRLVRMQNDSMSQILPVRISTEDQPENEILTYCMLDNQSDTSFCSDSLYEKLGIQGEDVRMEVQTLNSKINITCKRVNNLVIKSYYGTNKININELYTTRTIPTNKSHIPTKSKLRKWEHLKELPIPEALNLEVGLLLGYDCPQALKPIETIDGNWDEPYGVKTALGWTVLGKGSRTAAAPICNRILTQEIQEHSELLALLEQDFQESSSQENISQDDMKFLTILENGIHKLQDGSYELPLPFTKEPELPDNRIMALGRLKGLKSKFAKSEAYHNEYKAQMQLALEKGDAEMVPQEEVAKHAWYIPHHGVVHPKKNKLRVVYDCAAKYKNICINDVLLQGPDLLNKLIGVLLRFRLEKVAISCDVERMFYCFSVNKEHRDYLRFLWWPEGNTEVPPREYRMKKHIFGAKSSPGVANFALKRLANYSTSDQITLNEVTVTNFIQKNFYVDDGLLSVSTPEEAISIIEESKRLLAQSKMRLHKFTCNNKDVLEKVPVEDRAKEKEGLIDSNSTSVERVLGVQWCVSSDEFQFRITIDDKPATRRGILSCVASVFDPLGLIAPFVLVAKKIMQDILKQKCGWDETLSPEMLSRWNRWRASVPELSEVKLSRCFKKNLKGNVKTQLFSFSDASQDAYGQCTYVRMIDEKGNVNVSLAMAKARVAPSKRQTIPRLELQAATLSAKISSIVETEIENVNSSQYYTDSEIVLAYLNNDAKRFHVFVANRISRIKEATKPEQWHYISTGENPADHASRGLYPKELMKSNWLTGPAFLWNEKIPVVENSPSELTEGDPEVKSRILKTHTSMNETSVIVEVTNKCNTWKKAVTTVGYILRFVDQMKASSKAESIKLTLEEKTRAEKRIQIEFQQEGFNEEIEYLRKNQEITKRNSTISTLDPFIDPSGLLRVGGRQKKSLTGENHPIIIPKCHLARLLVRHHHVKESHSGRGMTLNSLRRNYWLIGATKAVSSELHKCIYCRKLHGRMLTQKMANLPPERVNPAPPFYNTGTDVFGPFLVKDGRKEMKRYGLVFTCLACRATHIEVLTDLSTDCFLLALRRFISIRGKVATVRCDNGTNFVGATHELKKAFGEVNLTIVNDHLKEKNIKFIFNCPAASHMGGVWERQIRTIRRILSPMLKTFGLRITTEELRTLMYECMNIVNSRPLSVENLSDPFSLPPITPNHLLQFRDPDQGPTGNFDEDVYSRKRWRRVQDLASKFWKRWQSEYLFQCNERKKWSHKSRNLKVGDLVMVKDEDQFSRASHLGKVVECKEDDDGLVRRAKILMADHNLSLKGKRAQAATILERPVQKLILILEIEKQ